MNEVEAYKAMIAGKRIRRVGYDEWFEVHGDKLITQHGEREDMPPLSRGETFEIVQREYTFMEAMMEPGKYSLIDSPFHFGLLVGPGLLDFGFMNDGKLTLGFNGRFSHDRVTGRYIKIEDKPCG